MKLNKEAGVHRTPSEAQKAAGSTKYNKESLELCCSLRSVCSFSYENDFMRV